MKKKLIWNDLEEEIYMAKILIVDDSTVMRKNLYSIFSRNGHEVVGEAVDGRQAILLYSNLKPDLVTMDITMPKMSGVDAVSEIIKKDSNAKIIMISALNQKQMVFEALKNGAKHYIIKPIEPNTLIGVVNEVLKDDTEIVEEKKEDIIEAEPGFKIDNKEGKFIVYFNEHLGTKDLSNLDTAIKGLLFIKPLNIVFDFGILQDISKELVQSIIKLGQNIEKSKGNMEYKSKSERLNNIIHQEA
jgi:Response regulator containing CheY-like receiver, AAA-type ATPase, and DNA-binding domains